MLNCINYFINMWNDPYSQYNNNPALRQIYDQTKVLRKPIAGIISGYHELPYILITPDDKNPRHSVEINGKISASPKFVIPPGYLGESFGDVFDPESFDQEIQGRLFTFALARKKNLAIKSDYLEIKKIEKNPQDHTDSVHDKIQLEENIKTALIQGPAFHYYPVSIDRFLSEIIDREMNV